jgi:hypothetical protein
MKNDYNQKAFLALVKAGLWETEARLLLNEEVDYSELLRLAEEQSVVGLVAAGLDHAAGVPYETKLKFIGYASQIQQRNMAMNRFIADLVSKLQSVGITPILVKGQGVAQCYERPLWRTSGDVDLILGGDDYRKAKELLLPLSTSSKECGKHMELVIDSWVVELHRWLRIGLTARINSQLGVLMRESFDSNNVRLWKNYGFDTRLLNADSDVVYVFVHFFNHFYKGGIGLRQICDWCRLLWTYRGTIDLPLLESRLREMRLVSEWKAFAAFAVEYLGMPIEAMPLYSSEERWKRKAKRICSFIMEVGNMGHNRDMSYYNTKPYLIQKAISVRYRCVDLLHHMAIFPLDSIRFFPRIMINGLRSAARGE